MTINTFSREKMIMKYFLDEIGCILKVKKMQFLISSNHGSNDFNVVRKES